MGAWKQFLASDIIVNPFVVNKGFTFTPGTSSGQFAYLGYTSSLSGEIINSDAVGINRFLGINGDYYTTSSLTGQLTSSLSGSVPAYLANFTQYNQTLVYNSVKQLYYSNFLSSSTGDNVSLPILIPGSDPSGDVLVSSSIQGPIYDDFLQSTLTPQRFWPTASDAIIGVLSVPSKLFGEYIQPYSFRLTSGSFSLIDDGEGNIFLENTTLNFGNTPVSSRTFTVADATALTTSKIVVTAHPTTENGAMGGDEFELDPIAVSGVCSANGTITIYATSLQGPVKGSRNFQYVVI